MRDRILETAIRLFAEQGYGSTSVRQIVEAVGCTKPVLYYHFGSKEKLFRAAVEAVTARYGQLVDAAMAGGGSSRERLRRFIVAYVHEVLAYPQGMRLLMTAQHRRDDGQPEIDLMELHRRNGEKVTTMFAEGVQAGEIRGDLDLRAVTLAFIGTVNMRVLLSVHGADRPAEAVADEVLTVLFEGIQPRPHAPSEEGSP